MKVMIRFTREEEAKALPILVRHSPGMVLRDRTYIVEEDAARTLRDRGVNFEEIGRESTAPPAEGVGAGERI